MIAILGDRDPAKLPHREVDAVIELLAPSVHCEWVGTDAEQEKRLSTVSGIWVAPGTLGTPSVLRAIRESLRSGRPLLGTCGGFQQVVVELARSLAGIAGATHGETEPDGADLVVAALGCALPGVYRPVDPVPGTRIAALCGSARFDAFHWCGYGVNEKYVAALEEAGVLVSARSEAAGVEAVELPDHPFFVATLFQPQMRTSESRAVHPLIRAFVAAAKAHRTMSAAS